METHWTRALYHDYFGRAADEAARSREEIMERHDGLYMGPVRVRTPLRAAAALLGIYVTMYLAVAGALYAVRGSDAAAGVPDPAIVAASCTQRS